jgi:hypothetical protein
MWLEAVGQHSIEHQITAGGRVESGDHVEERGLAGTIGANQAADRALLDHEINIVHRDKATKALSDAARLQNRCHMRTPYPFDWAKPIVAQLRSGRTWADYSVLNLAPPGVTSTTSTFS